jgi:tetratricopeptide (TPR) repeat protein
MSGKCDQAQKEFSALELQKAGATDFELRAYDAQSRSDYVTAIGLWKNLRDQTPAISRGYELGRAYAASGQNAEAERELRELVKAPPVPDLGSMSPINPIYDTRYILGHYELAKVLEGNGKPDEARKYYQSFLSFWGSGDLKLEEIEAAKKK